MRNTKLITILLIVIGSILFTGCVTGKRNNCLYPKKKGYSYTPRLQGGVKWNYKKYMGPKRKLIK
jgi:hypothetical protein